MGGVLDRLPAWTTTGVGSLPFTDPVEAVDHATGAYGLSFYPQLPRLEGDMISEWLALEREGGGRPSRRSALDLAVEVARWQAANAAGQVARLADLGLDAVLVVDEPALAIFGTDGVERAWEPLRAVAPAWGLHLCCHVPWDAVERAAPDMLSFDLALDRPGEEATSALRRLADRGGWIAWGAIEVASDERADAGARRLAEAIDRLAVDPSRSLLTASCGSGRLSPRREQQIATDLSLLADLAVHSPRA
jgi:hypothetical protein